MQCMARRRRRTAAPIKIRWFRNFIHLASAIMTPIFEADRHAIRIILTSIDSGKMRALDGPTVLLVGVAKPEPLLLIV